MAVGALASNAQGFIPVGSTTGSTAPVQITGREAASQSFKKGAVLIRSSGLVAIAAADAVADIIGVAAEDASGTTNALIHYYPVDGVVYEATLEDQTNENHALVVTNMYTDYAIQVDSNGIFYVDENDTTNVSVMVVGVRNDDDITDATVRARVKVMFHHAAMAHHT